MKLLVEFTPHGGVLQRLSNEDIPLTDQWFSYILSFLSVRLDIEKDYGGYVSPSYSDIVISPEAFESWPPSGDALFKIMITSDGEDEAVIIFDGYGTPTEYDREGVSYELTTPEYSATISKGAVQTGTLLSLITSYCSTLGLTLDSSNSRSTSPSVDYTPSSDVQLIDLMSDMCAFFTHAFKVTGGTLYLYDMLATGTAKHISEFDMQPCTYGKAKPIHTVKCGDISISGSSSYGSEYSVSTAYHTTESLVEDALTNIKTIIEKDVAEIETMIDQTSIVVLDDLTVFDESTVNETSLDAKAVSTLYNFDDYTLSIEAIGVVS